MKSVYDAVGTAKPMTEPGGLGTPRGRFSEELPQGGVAPEGVVSQRGWPLYPERLPFGGTGLGPWFPSPVVSFSINLLDTIFH